MADLFANLPLGLSALLLMAAGPLTCSGADAPKETPMTQTFRGARVELRRSITLVAPPDRVFPLLCPVREGEWADGWVGRPVFARSGVTEQDGVFATVHPGEEDTIWMITRHDPARHEVEMVYFMPGRQAVRLSMGLQPTGPKASSLWVHYVRTGLSEAGNKMLKDPALNANFEKMMVHWEASLNHFLKTGSCLKERP
ncbi:MAG: hypothetical protein HY823_10630 [Acidobacteria bacterium]|nr:hypothetical protein [Acidobacteriota bacterium]